MIDAIQTGHVGLALTTRDPQARRDGRRSPRRIDRPDAAERVEIDDAIEASNLAADAPDAAVAAGATVTAESVARRLVAAADRALAVQARLGSTMVLRLAGEDG